jgi:hypothetical protein
MSNMQPQYYKNTRGLRRLELEQLHLVKPPPPPITSRKSKSPRTREKKNVGTSWQDSIYKPNSAHSPNNEMGATCTLFSKASSLQNLTLVMSEPNTKQIEVAPGEFLPLIGADETRDAVREMRTVHTTCLVCSLALVCANQADCVLCPRCRVVSPITDNTPSLSTGKKRHYTFGGVGIGLSEREYIELQQHHEQEAFIRQLGASLSSF